MKVEAIVVVGFLVLATTVVVADVIDSPGTFTYVSNVDSKVHSTGTGAYPVYVQLGTESILGDIDSNGDATFLAIDFAFDIHTDGSSYTAQVQATGSATGTFCPNSGEATITMTGARIRVTQVNGTSISATPCFIQIRNSADTSNTFVLTTKTSGSYTGTDFSGSSGAEFVAEVILKDSTGTCSAGNKLNINSHYGTGTVGVFRLPGTSISPGFSGNGC